MGMKTKIAITLGAMALSAMSGAAYAELNHTAG